MRMLARRLERHDFPATREQGADKFLLTANADTGKISFRAEGAHEPFDECDMAALTHFLPSVGVKEMALDVDLDDDPAAFASELNRVLCRLMPDESFAALI